MSDPEIGWDDLSAPLRDRVDAALRSRQTLAALTMLCQEEIGPRLGLVQGQGIVAARYALLTDRDEVEADSAVNLERLNARVDAIPDSTVAIEALWDGDTDGWLVALVAVVERPGRQHARFDDVSLALIRSGTDLRVFNGNVPPWPEAVEATRLGRAMAEARGVPFYFFDPATPDTDQPRWWDSLA